ncbi:aldehyde dehydrogenase family protein [Porticoccus sp. W117]|uniref:aldehyde dehydrogenase family protein n=1 Tax=Porticoccus sp. W117 TaxID=3054777 RepID=UPI00259273A7|nr:aldehyde dehydrogenase family protein [Porticoccus sp. W117]MDM3870109.1 aldehyde dehydrogenase family protein [Porticoccus sp. W117]
MENLRKFYIDGQWVEPLESTSREVENPATGQSFATTAMGSAADVERAITAARAAFDSFSQTSREERLAMLERLLAGYMERYDEIAAAITQEMGAPISFSKAAQADTGRGHIQAAIDALKNYQFEESTSSARVVKEPIGVCGFICPWNWPMNQIVCKVAPAIAAGCTMVVKPSEETPLSAMLFTEVVHQAGIPAGVYNVINGPGSVVGEVLSTHPEVDLVSLTGSTRVGALVSKAAADSIKRVALELGGKSPNLILDDADMEKAVKWGVFNCFENTGQSCNAPTRMLVPQSRYEEALDVAVRTAAKVQVGDPTQEGRHLGPMASKKQYDTTQRYIQIGIDEGARLLWGGLGKPEGLEQGYYAKPTIFADVRNDMTIAQEEIFGPVLCIIPYGDEEEGIAIANDSIYGLAGYVQGSDVERCRRVARRIKAGMIHLNGAYQDYDAPFGGYKQSGNCREWGAYAFEDFLEIKAINGF